jgi:hypothetical protein
VAEDLDDHALELLEDGDLFEVLEHDHPEFSLYVSFDDEIATEYDNALDRLVDEVAEVPDVVRAVREDREVILVGGRISAPALEEWLADWWRSELRQQPPRERGRAKSPSPNRDRRFWFRRLRNS